MMVGFRRVKHVQWQNLGDNWRRKLVLSLEPVDTGVCLLGLFGAMEKDDRAVLGTDIVPLAIQGSGVVAAKKNIQEVLVAENGWFKNDLHHFDVAGFATADLLVSWLRGFA